MVPLWYRAAVQVPPDLPCGDWEVVEGIQRAFVLFASYAAVDENTARAGLGFRGPR